MCIGQTIARSTCHKSLSKVFKSRGFCLFAILNCLPQFGGLLHAFWSLIEHFKLGKLCHFLSITVIHCFGTVLGLFESRFVLEHSFFGAVPSFTIFGQFWWSFPTVVHPLSNGSTVMSLRVPHSCYQLWILFFLGYGICLMHGQCGSG